MTAQLRTPTADDAAAIARVHTESWRETYGGVFPESYFDARALERRIDHWTRSLETPEPGNDRAGAFYRRNGFEPDGAAREIPFVPGFGEIRMVR